MPIRNREPACLRHYPFQAPNPWDLSLLATLFSRSSAQVRRIGLLFSTTSNLSFFPYLCAMRDAFFDPVMCWANLSSGWSVVIPT